MASPRPSSRTWLAAAVLLILVLSPCLGLGGGVAYLSLHRDGAFARWRSLGTPPTPAASFVAGDTAVIFAATATGAVYRCEAASQVRDACWLPAEPPYTVDARADYEHSVITGDPPATPSGTVEVLYVSRFYAEMALEARYALLSDGSVSVWQHQSSGYTALLVLLAAPILGLGLGFVLVIVLLVAYGAWRRARSA